MTDRNSREPMLIAPDPAGVVYALSGGRIRDPIGNAVRRSLTEASRLDREAAEAQERIVTNQEATESRETADSDQDEEMVERQTGEHVQTVL